MNTKGSLRQRLKHCGRVAEILWYVALAFLIVLAVIAGFGEPATKERPSGAADVMAPLCAFLVALLALPTIARVILTRNVGVSIAVVIGYLTAPCIAYFWLVDAAEVHPTDPQTPLLLGAFIAGGFIIVAILGGFFWVAFSSEWGGNSKESPD